jgi:hypothetical protein
MSASAPWALEQLQELPSTKQVIERIMEGVSKVAMKSCAARDQQGEHQQWLV